jgi:sortase B
MNSTVRKILIVVFALAFLVSGGLLLRYYLQGLKEEEAFTALSKTVESAPEAPGETKYAALKTQNPDFAAWLKVDGTDIDYPVVCTPDDPEYYLRRGFDGEYSYSGTPFVGAGCTVDSSVCIIHGHNMKNGTMFSTLDSFSKAEFRAQHPYITLTTVEEERTYEVFSAVLTNAYAPYFTYVGDVDEETFGKLTSWLSENELYDTGIEVAYGDSILILSTCEYSTDNGRFVVAARKVA